MHMEQPAYLYKQIENRDDPAFFLVVSILGVEKLAILFVSTALQKLITFIKFQVVQSF